MSDPSLEAWVVRVGKEQGWTQIDFEEGESIVVTKDDMDAFDQYKGKVDTMVRMRLNELKLTSLAESSAVKSAIAEITNQASFASEFEATPKYKEALAEAFIGGVSGATEKATTSALGALGLPAVAGPMFKFINTLVNENKRALAASSEKSVKDFLNKALHVVVAKLGSELQALGKDAAVVQACLEGAHEKAMGFYEDDKANPGRAQQRETKLVAFCDDLQKALGAMLDIGQVDLGSTHKAALEALITGLTAKGYIDFGVISLDTELVSDSPAGQVFKQKGDVKFEDGPVPKLCGTAKDDKFANALTDYLAHAGGTVNDLDIEKRAHFKLHFAGSGPFSFLNGHTMDGRVKWTRGTPGSLTVDGGDLLALYKGDIPTDYLKNMQQAYTALVQGRLTATRVTA